ncbi:glycosyl transferases group 1 family protein [Francisella philomiragia]|uniref:glycosyltransferase family 4 protein n=1 Tax=Francisella philomiragia TaxID=28110 RepID=UPI0005A57F5E|nr:glycosyltransferase family 4 protein [Francisella philomiragia]AJI57482.1 glycosyl transferases group 1 family protein [Francisella philomiragia]
MRIALVIEHLSIGGGPEHLFQICKNMPHYDFKIFAKSGINSDKFKDLKNVEINNGYAKKDIELYEPDIVHFHSMKPFLFLYKLKFFKLITIHGFHIHKYEFKNGVVSKVRYFLRKKIEKFLYIKADQLITISDEDEITLQKLYGLNSIKIYNGIYYSLIENIKSKEFLKKELGFLPNKTICITISRFDFQKDYLSLVKSIEFLNKKYKGFVFYFVGDGDTKLEVEHYVKSKNIENIIFLGVRRDVNELLKASDIFILPSRWEGLSIAALEALDAKKKLLLSDTYGNRTIARYSKNVELFSLDDYEDLADRIDAMNTKEYLDEENFFTLDKMITSIDNVYKKALE